ncbi:MAG TPA: TonB-dependent receptor, partial [Chromatiales bacterium]|nr:TonB-dependent receptor [Chromatiales bacterium]
MKTTLTLLTVATVGLGTTAISASAEETLPNIVTIASRTPIERNRIGSAISIVDRDLLEQRQSVTVADILQDLPGLAISRAGGPGQQTQLRIRGAEANHVLVVIDGVRVNDPAIGDEFSFEQLTSWDVDNIEVVRGPQSALWGSDAMAGVINIT